MKCAHCRLDFDQRQMLQKGQEFFCCAGCMAVFELVHSKGLGDFYEKLGNKNLEPVKLEQELFNFNNFVRSTDEGLSEIHLIINGIHCAACVWLNEKILIEEQGIIEANINLLTHKARIVFDERVLSIERIVTLIQSIGYKPIAYDPLKQEQRAVATRREFYSKLVVAVACVMNVMWIAVAKYAGFFSVMDAEVKDILNYAEFILASPVLFYTGSSFYKNAYYSLKHGQISMDFLVIFGASLAYIYSLWAMFSRAGEVYFDSVAMIICFVFVGKYLEVLVKKHATDTMDSLNDFLKGEILVFNGTQFVPKDAYAVQIGDLIQLKTGNKILIDGICVRGEASVDTSSLSGESEPMFINAGKNVNSACIVLDGSIEYKATKLYVHSKLHQIISLLEFSQNHKPRIQSLASQISVYFSRTILAVAGLCFCFWYFIQHSGAEFALINAISVLIIACPCALALATPVSNLIALFQALKFKVLFKSSSKIEDLSKCNMAVFDKTGVLTNSKLEIAHHEVNEEADLNELLAFIKLSNHPISASISEFLQGKVNNKKHLPFCEVKEMRAKGIRARLKDDQFIGGNVHFLQECGISVRQNFDDTHFIFAKNGAIFAHFEFKSVLRSGASELIAYLKALKIPIKMLTGDNEKAAQKIALQLDIKDYKASCLPETKMNIVADLSQNYKVLMVGDGINDALALKNAAVAVSLKQGSDLAVENSDIILLKNDLFALKQAIKLSKKTFIIIKQNLAFSLCYNALTIPLAFLGLINPLIAAASMSLSSIAVILNSLRIRNE